jgi:hypothetical protein
MAKVCAGLKERSRRLTDPSSALVGWIRESPSHVLFANQGSLPDSSPDINHEVSREVGNRRHRNSGLTTEFRRCAVGRDQCRSIDAPMISLGALTLLLSPPPVTEAQRADCQHPRPVMKDDNNAGVGQNGRVTPSGNVPSAHSARRPIDRAGSQSRRRSQGTECAPVAE